MPIVFKVAESAEDKEAIFKLRHRVFVEQEQRFHHQLPHIVDMFDCFNETINIMAIKEENVIGSIRVVLDNSVGLPATEHYDFSPYIRSVEGKCACFGWLCTLKEYRNHPGLLIGLFKMAVHEMRKYGGTHVIATIHPPLMKLLQRSFNAIRVGKDFKSEGLGVPMTPAFLSPDTIPSRAREIFDYTSNIILQDSSIRKIYQEGEIITEKGQQGDEAFLILRGSVRVLPTAEDGTTIFPEKDNYHRIGNGDLLFSKGEILGELSLLDGGIRTATIIPYSKEVDVMVWSKDVFMNQLRADAQNATRICELLAGRLRKQIQKESEISLPCVSTVARILLDASDDGENEVNVKWLARQCGFWPENLLEATEKWRNNNVISLTEANIRVLNPPALLQNSESGCV